MLLWPISWLYGILMSIRNMLFDKHILPTESFPISVISVGNITVGGT
ncbi:MAG: tetraacyldisaccharide 4'-kinase, partial [Paludibacteraceae bacterium]|nr:tetraacyldisaccharide 4'-kinase [Paludibacteraceae bacterium]